MRPSTFAGIEMSDVFVLPPPKRNRSRRLRKKLRIGEFNTPGFDYELTWRTELLDKLGEMIEQSGSVPDMAALRVWFDHWIAEPLPELNGNTPGEAVRSESGRGQVETLLERMRGGLPG